MRMCWHTSNSCVSDTYKVPEGDSFGQQAEKFDLNLTLYECVNDRADAAMCTGSGFVVRRQALSDISGWPLIDSPEDFMCSTCLRTPAGRQHSSMYVHLGLIPETLRCHLKQRMRWVLTFGLAVHQMLTMSNLTAVTRSTDDSVLYLVHRHCHGYDDIPMYNWNPASAAGVCPFDRGSGLDFPTDCTLATTR